MVRTCSAWSTAVLSDAVLWRAIALRAYPRLIGLAEKVPNRPWAELYRAHREMTTESPPDTADRTRLEDYVLTYELAVDSKVIASWSGSLEYGTGEEETTVTIQLPPDLSQLDDKELTPGFMAATSLRERQEQGVRLSGVATRCVPDKPLRMCKLFECYLDDVDFEEDESLVFFNGDGDPMPHSRPALYMICSDFFGSYVTAHPVLHFPSGKLTGLFYATGYDDACIMNTKQTLTFLEHCVTWDRSSRA